MKRINNWVKLAIGWVIWTVGTFTYAVIIHYAPEGTYAGSGSSIEVFASCMAVVYLIGVPILTVLWIYHSDSDQRWP